MPSTAEAPSRHALKGRSGRELFQFAVDPAYVNHGNRRQEGVKKIQTPHLLQSLAKGDL
jgi:hypothetical protein